MTPRRSDNRIYIVGAGITGITLAREIRSKGIFGKVVAFLDDDPQKIGSRIHSVPVLGPIEEVVELLKTTPADEAIIAIPGATRERLKRIFRLLVQAGFVRIRFVPRISQILDGEAHLIQARQINPEDLLSRDPIQVNLKHSLAYLRGKRVLVTGAGGSIGAELCRQLLSGGAERLYLFGHGENSIYEIDRELRLLQEEGVGERATIVPILGELQDRDFMLYIVKRTRADVVFHTAAHKHVPMLEANPVEAVKNNVFGTRNILEAARGAEVERFVLVSTDKAVDPGSVYGASKLIAEELVLRQEAPGKVFLVVRFGNVLGSRGSILPLFRSQILKGGPVTLTDARSRRFFMTIPEAASLVLQAGGVGETRDLYLLDMGEPVSIKDMAEQMVRFYGYEPHREIQFVYTGLRPGEKLQESLWSSGDRAEATEYPKILKLDRHYALNGQLEGVIDRLQPICFFDPGNPEVYRDRTRLRQTLKEIVPTLRVPEDEPPH
ncbi:MAG: polysaccharide biosynthesis protein [Spirochaetales bacterium]|nr:polysaccharide biosynthesis protein [Spirochaetales bacterium]